MLNDLPFNNARPIDFQPCPGDTVWAILQKVKAEKLNVQYDTIIIHAGTNDIDSGLPAEEVVELVPLRMRVLVQEIAARNPDAVIAISGILPRPCDNDRTSETVRRCNGAMWRLARDLTFLFKNRHNPTVVRFITTYRSFLHRTTGNIRPEMFGKRGLHPSTAGKKALARKYDQFCNHQEKPAERSQTASIDNPQSGQKERTHCSSDNRPSSRADRRHDHHHHRWQRKVHPRR